MPVFLRGVVGLYLAASSFALAANDAYLELGKTGLEPRELAVVVNDADPLSRQIGDYYLERRGIPKENLIHVRLPVTVSNLPAEQFKPIKESIDRQTGAHIQAYALAWTQPYRVDCMSITSAVALGFDRAYCSASGCTQTKPSGYFNSSSHAPYSDHHLRPAMLLAGKNMDEVRKLIDRGIASDHTFPTGTGYMLSTWDKKRSVRSVLFKESVKLLGDAFHLQDLDANSISDKQDVLFYFIGRANVPNLSSLRFIPGGFADHLTSAGGQLTDSYQMSSLRFLEAGATASYGAVVEPCNLLEKFPHPGVAIWRYAEGNTLIEAYWKSVLTPGEGVFIGEPLAKPFGPVTLRDSGGQVTLRMFAPQAKNVTLESAESGLGPYRPKQIYPVKAGLNAINLSVPNLSEYYRVKF